MWNRITGKSSGIQEDPPSQISRRNHNEKRSKDSRSESIVSSSSNKKSSARINDQFSKSSKKSSRQGDDPDRGFNPTSKSFSSTTSSPYPGIASASVATASGNHNDEPYIPPVLVRNASLADQMPKSRSSRDERTNNEGWAPRSEQWNDRNDNEKESGWGDHERRAEEKRGNKDKDRLKKSSKSTKSGLKGSGYREDEGRETTRGPTDFSDQIEASGFSQFPGQDNGGILNTNGKVSGPQMSSHIQDQFPGQFANQSSAPHQPPISFSEGGPGLAAEYYGDAGESVAEQPGNRANTPSLIIGAEPHLQAALAVAAPPPEPSASGEVGAAASFFTGDFDEHESATGHDQHTSATVPARPQGSHHSSSAPAIPTVSGAAIGAAAGYFMGSQNSSHTQRPNHPSSVGGAPQDHDYSSYQRPPAPTAESHYSNASRPPRPGKPSSQSSNAPLYAAGAVDVAATISQHSHQNLSQHNSLRPQNSTTPMAQRHRSHGPLEAVVEFFKDPDGVAEFEEYSEFIGVCKYCFAPGSSARDAPRKHYYRRKRSNDSLGRVDKESRYHSSENERRRGKDKSWLASSLAGYGLAKVGESLYKQRNDFDSTYSVKTGRFSPDARGEKSPRRRQSKDNNEIGITNAGKVYKKDLQGVSLDRPEAGTYESRRHSHYNSRSRDRRSGLADATISATTGSSMEAPSAPHRTSASPINAFVNIEHRNGEQLPNRRYKPHSERRQGFFSMSNAASSSSSVDTVRQSDRHQSSKRTRATSKDDRKAEAAILGLGAAAAALTPNNGRTGHRKKGVKKVTVLKKARRSHSRDSRHDHGSEDEVWESAPETEYGSADSGLAYGGPSRKGSRESLSSDSSGTNKWGWRWGRKKEQRAVPVKRNSSEDINLPVIADGAGAGSTGAAMMSHGQHQRKGNDSNSSLPLQQVFPIPTSDPTLFDVGGETSTAASKRPAVVPIQHPQPITPVSATLYATQPPQKHSYSAPTGPPVFSPKVYPSQPAIGFDARFVKPEFAAPGSFAQDIPQVKGPGSNSKFRRRDSSPARFGDDAVSSTMTSHKRASTRDDTSAVRFDRTEDQEENDRRERRRNRREDRKRREAEEQEQEQIEKERKVSTEKSDKKSEIGARRRESPQRSSETSSAAPAAAGIIGAAIGVIASEKMSTPEESREERRERRRRDREREEAEDQEATRRRERRRKEREREREREREVDESVGNEPQTISDQISRVSEDIDRQERATDKQTSDLQEARCSPTSRTSHEDYGTFFRPLDLGNSSQQAKVTSANDSADVDFDQSPSIVTVAPKGFRDPDAQPTFSPADTDEATDTSILSFPVPRLRLVEPTPPSSRGSTPITWPQDTGIEDIEEPSRDHTPSKVTWGDDQTHEYTVISPDEDDDHGQLVGSAPSDISDTGLREGSPPLDKSELPSDIELTKDSPSVPEAKYPPVSFGDDAEFAATLAASAEDAGFDPSIVVDNPMYSRRESPPGSNDRSMPGGFDDNETYSLSRKDKSRKDREAKLRFESEEPKPPDDNGVSEDIFSHVKNIDSPNRKDSVDNLPDSWGTGKRSKSKKSKKDRKQDSGFKEESYEFSGSVVKPHEPESRETYESPSEDTPSVTSSVPLTIEGDSSTKSRKKSKRDSVSFDDTASSISAPSTETASREPKSTKKSSVWARVIGRSPQENGTKDLPDEANMDKFEELRRKNKKSKGRRSNGDEIDDNEGSSKRSALGEPENNRPDSGGSVGPDLPAKVHSPAFIDSAAR
jgi:serine/arginine repetitive matrix protein 2